VNNDSSWCQGESSGTLDLVTGFTQPADMPRIALTKHEMVHVRLSGVRVNGLRLPMSSFGKLIATLLALEPGGSLF
jgi:hypothetical protein